MKEDNELECAVCERGYTRENSQKERPNICSTCFTEEEGGEPPTIRLISDKQLSAFIAGFDEAEELPSYR